MSLTSISQSFVPKMDFDRHLEVQNNTTGNRRVAVETGAEPRATESRSFMAKVGDLFSRTIGSLAGGQPRAVPPGYGDLTPAARDQLHGKMERDLGKIIDALTTGGGDRVKVSNCAKALGKLIDTATPLTSHPGASQVITARMDAVISGMTPDQQMAALRGIQSDRGGEVQARLTDNPMANKALMMLEQQLGSTLLDAEGERATGKANEALAKGMSDIPNLLGNSIGKMKNEFRASYDQMANMNLRPNSDSVRQEYVATGTLKLLAETGADPQAPIDGDVLKAMDTQTLHGLASRANPEGLESAVQQIKGELNARLAALMDGLPEKIDTLTATFKAGQTADMPALTRPLGEIADALTASLKFSARAEVSDAPVRQAMQDVATHLDLLATNGELDLSALSDAELHRMEGALKAIGSDSASTMVSTEADTRRASLRSEYHGVLDTVLDAVRNDDLSGLLSTIRATADKRDEVAFSLEPLGLKLDGADEIMSARAMLVDTRLADLDLDDLIGLHSVLSRPDVRALSYGVTELSYDLIEVDEQDFRKMFDVGTDLMLLRSAVQESLEGRGVSLPPRPDADVRDGLATMTKGGFTAVRETFGLEANKDGVTRIVDGTLKGNAASQFEALIATPADTPEQIRKAVVNHQQTVVCEQFISDFHRATYMAGGESLLDRDAWAAASSDQRTSIVENGISALKDVLGNDDDLAFAVSQYANQASLFPVIAVLNGPDTPVRLQDGTPVLINPLQQLTSYSIGLTDDGEATLKINFENVIRGTQGFDGKTHWLTPDHRTASFDMELTINRDGSARLTQPLHFSLDMQEDTLWPSDMPYARPDPTDAAAALARQDELRSDLHAFSKTLYAEENIDFYLAVRDYQANPTPQVAQFLFDTYVAEDSPKQVNLSGKTLTAVTQALNTTGATSNLFQAAMPETLDNISDTLGKFVRHKQESFS